MPKPGQVADPVLGLVLRQLREERGETREALAYRSGVGISSLSEIERGRANPSWATVRALAGALGVRMGELGDAIDAQED